MDYKELKIKWTKWFEENIEKADDASWTGAVCSLLAEHRVKIPKTTEYSKEKWAFWFWGIAFSRGAELQKVYVDDFSMALAMCRVDIPKPLEGKTGMYRNRKCPCFECSDTREPEECLLVRGNDEGEPDCIYIQDGLTWEECPSGKLDPVYVDYEKRSKPPDKKGLYIIWEGFPYESAAISVIWVDDQGLPYRHSEYVPDEPVEWQEGWQWSHTTWKEVFGN